MIKNLDILFPKDKDKKEAAEHLRVLAGSKGWQIISQMLEEDLKKIDIQLKTKKFDKENIEKLYELQNKFAYLLILKQLPEKLRAVLLGKENIEEINFDVYD